MPWHCTHPGPFNRSNTRTFLSARNICEWDHSGNQQSHFVNAASWGRLVDRLVDVISSKRRTADRSGRWALVLVDAAPQHILLESVVQKALEVRVLFKTLPESQTHVWQPCDMFAMAAIKRRVDHIWDEVMELSWSSLPHDEAFKQASMHYFCSYPQRKDVLVLR